MRAGPRGDLRPRKLRGFGARGRSAPARSRRGTMGSSPRQAFVDGSTRRANLIPRGLEHGSGVPIPNRCERLRLGPLRGVSSARCTPQRCSRGICRFLLDFAPFRLFRRVYTSGLGQGATRSTTPTSTNGKRNSHTPLSHSRLHSGPRPPPPVLARERDSGLSPPRLFDDVTRRAHDLLPGFKLESASARLFRCDARECSAAQHRSMTLGASAWTCCALRTRGRSRAPIAAVDPGASSRSGEADASGCKSDEPRSDHPHPHDAVVQRRVVPSVATCYVRFPLIFSRVASSGMSP